MKRERANLIAEEIFARWPARFCRVVGAAAGNFPAMVKNMPVFQMFYGYAGFISPWHGRC